ncbi:MAG: type VI secretion system tube protein Hcp [Opitutaceae bacterium]|jgi:type VI protein secretion system component Hcp|nr:type VI secretion system tube protein Hcp [Opitutaceae bacterium]
MPFYAYIKIPGVGQTESSDDCYGNGWIPIEKFDLGGEQGDDYDGTEDDTGKKTDSADFTNNESGDGFSSEAEDDVEEQQKLEKKISAEASMSIDKMLDVSSPVLHRLCLEHLREESALLNGAVELHICRVGGDKSPELIMAYRLENCAISLVEVHASENGLTEMVKLKFQKITCATNFEQKEWMSSGWDMVRGEKLSAGWKPAKPK